MHISYQFVLTQSSKISFRNGIKADKIINQQNIRKQLGGNQLLDAQHLFYELLLVIFEKYENIRILFKSKSKVVKNMGKINKNFIKYINILDNYVKPSN